MLAIPVTLIWIAALMNAINLIDGLDGLSCGVSTISSISIFAVIMIQGGKISTEALITLILIGSCAGFLPFNRNPARIFMGDTGSLFLGGMIVAMGFGIGYPILILPIGIIYFAETLSVIIQVSYFKLTRRLTGQGKRIFKMSPIHHHFEMCGWNEVKIVTVFSLVTVIGGALAVLSVLLG
jgi:phospho-N-acetylmuramoyl-pentapeptide-transferase